MTEVYRISYMLKRAVSGFRRRPWLHLLSAFTLAAAFASFGATFVAARNLENLLERWVGSAEITVYLRQNADPSDAQRLSEAVASLEGVREVEITGAIEARETLASYLGEGGEMARDLPLEAFPSSVDVFLAGERADDPRSRQQLAARLAEVDLVQEVEVYDEWFDRLFALSSVGRAAVWGLGLLALVVAVLVTAATVRAGVGARRREIRVLRFFGATEHYVRLPFLLEGALEATAAMGLALLLLELGLERVERLAGEILPLIGGGELVGLTATTTAALLTGGLVAGLLGAGLSLRRIEEV